MVLNERDGREETALAVARHMLAAARTAPKAMGRDIIECAALTGADKDALAEKLRELGESLGKGFFIRDAGCVDKSQVVVLVGTGPAPCGLNCTRCGFESCAAKPAEVPCALNTVDVGIALGSAVSVAEDLRADTRIIFSGGVAAQELGFLGDKVSQVYAIPVSISSKSPFFDRK
jgi:uncharacterized ferredoxin-like protein